MRRYPNLWWLFLFQMIWQVPFGLAQEEDLSVLTRWVKWSSPETLLMRHLNLENFRLIDQREALVRGLKSKQDWINRRGEVRKTLSRIIGPFPERTPLNPIVTGVLKQQGYRVEKTIFESIPGFYVTGALFVPDGVTEPRPGILNVIGHSGQAFRRDIYQNVIINLVTKGFVVFAIDPLGQGERLQYFDPASGESSVGSSTREHSHCGNQCLLTGYSVARYFIWDGIRAIDYLASRPEVDASRIGVTGLSGGGTQTAMIAAVDDRVVAAAPACYITSYRRLLETIGPQDGEQNLFHGLTNSIDHADFLLARAPRPTLVVATTRDYFSIQGVHETAAELQRVYRAFGVPELFLQVEDDSGHGFTRKNNEAIYGFFQKHLQLPGNPAEQELPLFQEAELNATTTGQISTSLQGRTVFDLNLEEAQPLLDRLETKRRDDPLKHLEESLQKARGLSGYRRPQSLGQPVYRGRYQRRGYTIEKHALPGEGSTVLPLLVFVPEGKVRHPAVIYLNPAGKQADASSGDEIEQLAKNGYLVLAPDPLGFGETSNGIASSHSHVAAFYNAQLAGRSIVGLHAGDIVRVLNYGRSRDDVSRDLISLVAIGELGPAALLATALEASVHSLVLQDAPLSYANIVKSRFYEFSASAFVAGALGGFDLPDLMANIAPRPLVLLGMRDPMKEPATQNLLDQELKFARTVYGLKSVPDRLTVMSGDASLVEALEKVD